MEMVFHSSQKMVCSSKYYSLISLMILNLFTPVTAAESVNYVVNSFSDPTNFGNINHVAININSGKVYVGAVNKLYQLSENLTQEKSAVTGPKDDSPNCRPNTTCEGYERISTNSVSKALVIDYDDSKILTCSNIMQGHCEKRKLSDITQKDRDIWMPMVPFDEKSPVVMFIANGPDPNESNEGCGTGGNALYIGATRSTIGETSFRDTVPSLASRRLDDFQLTSTHILGGKTIFNVADFLRDVYKINFLYGFPSGGFSYFLATQKGAVHDVEAPLVTKISRVCQNDCKFSSYVEMNLICSDYSVLRAAYVTRPASSLALNLEIAHKGQTHLDDVLFAVFGKEKDEAAGSALCMYRLRDIRSKFTTAIAECFMGQGNFGTDYTDHLGPCVVAGLTISDDYCGDHDFNNPISRGSINEHPVVTFVDDLVTGITVTTTFDYTVSFMGTTKGLLKKELAEYICPSETAFREWSMLSTSGTSISQSRPVHQDKKCSEDSESTLPEPVVMVVIESKNQAVDYETVVVSKSGQSINADLVIDRSKTHIYVATDKEVQRLKVQDCSQYTSCSSCLRAHDPYCGWCSLESSCSIRTECLDANLPLRWVSYMTGNCTQIREMFPNQTQIHKGHSFKDCASCVSIQDIFDWGWCGDMLGHCSLKDNCATSWKNDSCPPLFFDFEPRSGPVQGGTSVTLKGRYFGNATAATTKIVMMGLEPCKTQLYNSTMIICTTKASEALVEKTTSVSVEVVDTSKTTVGFEISGKANLDPISFTYKKLELAEVIPLFGPKSGGSKLTLIGRNLDVGTKLAISVADLPCKPLEIIPEKIVCKTSAVPSIKKRSVRQGFVKVVIDNIELTNDDLVFTYEENPYVTDVSPRRTIASGGISVRVSVGNLHVIHLPQIVIQDLVSGVNYWDDCKTTPEEIICTTPKILRDGFGNKPTAERPLNFTLNLAMDGVLDLINFPSQHPEMSYFQYHVDPVIEKWDDDDSVIKNYIENDYLELKGSNLDLGAARDDYQVTVDGVPCKVMSVTSKTLNCTPDAPDVVAYNKYRREVLVTVGSLSFGPGYLIFEESNVNSLKAAILAPVLVILCVVFIIILLVWMKKLHKGPFKPRGEQSVRYNRNTDSPDTTDRLQGNAFASSAQMLHQEQIEEQQNKPLIDSDCRNFLLESHLLIDRENVLLLDVIGQGNFGCVYKGLLKVPSENQETEVAVKTLKTLTAAANTSSADARCFLEEALRMMEFDHPNILRLIGITLEKEEQPLVILPFMKYGDLLTVIRDETKSLTIKDLMDFAIQIAEGMAYLSTLRFVHRDLAARNCMLNDAMEVQVADFGLSRDIYERDYYSSDGRKTKLPVKWMALESLEKGIYNIKTDVWSYGIVLWELMTRGVTPYPEVGNWEIIKFLKPGRRMPQPAYCPDSLYHIMLQCWDPEATTRPTFPELVTTIKRITYKIENRQEQQHQTQSQHQMYVNVPTTQGYLYPSKLPNYGPEGAGDI